ncbi:MAG: glycosyltransferase family 39 protein [Gemmatimonadaceae bacterium]|nr:glycosyltransferase family 39 protein [Gemmatimonadaceae bacterium]
MPSIIHKSLDPAEFRTGPNPVAWKQATRIVWTALALRLAVGAIVPLFPDEAYYWDWSRHLAAGYFDHPPAIAWLIRAGTLLLGDTSIGVRLLPILVSGAAALGIVRAARAVGGDASARLAAVLVTVIPLIAAGSVLATPDIPMLCGAAWTLYAVLRALGLPDNADTDASPDVEVEPDPRSAANWWLAAGVAIGLAMASKYTSVLLPVGVAAAFIAHGKLQNRLAQRGPYLAVVVATIVLLPVLGWNAVNDWISFRFQFGHGLGAPKGGALGAVNRELELLGGQVGLVSPILFFFVARAVRNGLRYSEEGFRLVLAMTCVVPLAFFAYSATRRSVEANWPALAWAGAIVLAASDLPPSRRMRAWLGGGIWLAFALSLGVYVHVIVPILPLPAPRDQVAKAFGWDLVATVVDRKRQAIPQLRRGAAPADHVFVAAERYQDAAELAFHLPDHPQVYSLNLTGRANQYDLWSQLRDDAPLGSAVVLLLDDEDDEPRVIRKLGCCFTRIDESEGVSLMRGDEVVKRKRIWILTGRSDGWPLRDQPLLPK